MLALGASEPGSIPGWTFMFSRKSTVAQEEARQAHNLEVVRSKLTGAHILLNKNRNAGVKGNIILRFRKDSRFDPASIAIT